MTKLTQKEHGLLKDMHQLGYNWVARDRKGGIYVYESKPIKLENNWYSFSYTCELLDVSLDFIRFEDEEPYEISTLVGKYEKENFIEIRLRDGVERISREDAQSLLTQITEALR